VTTSSFDSKTEWHVVPGYVTFRSNVKLAYLDPGYLGKSEGRQVVEPFLTLWTNE
jgi:hypothetical protein